MNEDLFSSNTDDWATPQDLFDALDAEFHFTLDPCSSEQNHKCDRYFTKEDNGLLHDWGGICLLQPALWSVSYTHLTLPTILLV